MRIALHVLLRLAAYAGIWQFFLRVPLFPDDDGLGTGLTAFATFALVALVWGAVDGWCWSVGQVAAVWVPTGLLVTLVMSYGDAWSDVVLFTTTVLTLVTAPALVTGCLVSVLRPRRPAPLR